VKHALQRRQAKLDEVTGAHLARIQEMEEELANMKLMIEEQDQRVEDLKRTSAAAAAAAAAQAQAPAEAQRSSTTNCYVPCCAVW
jgi:peptidoglycan hydrolase CwlO-like protein